MWDGHYQEAVIRISSVVQVTQTCTKCYYGFVHQLPNYENFVTPPAKIWQNFGCQFAKYQKVILKYLKIKIGSGRRPNVQKPGKILELLGHILLHTQYKSFRETRKRESVVTRPYQTQITEMKLVIVFFSVIECAIRSGVNSGFFKSFS